MVSLLLSVLNFDTPTPEREPSLGTSRMSSSSGGSDPDPVNQWLIHDAREAYKWEREVVERWESQSRIAVVGNLSTCRGLLDLRDKFLLSADAWFEDWYREEADQIFWGGGELPEDNEEIVKRISALHTIARERLMGHGWDHALVVAMCNTT